jgi:AraC-like DNA-binding protein
MSNFYITQYSIGYLSPALLAVIISFSIFHLQFRVRRWKADQTSLALYFLGAGVYCTLNFIGFSLYSPAAQVIWYLQTFSPFTILFLVMFSYHYPSPHHRKEFVIVMTTGSLLTLAAIIEYRIGCLSVPVRLYGQIYGSEYASRAIPLLNASLYLWTITVFLRRVIHFEKMAGAECPVPRMLLHPSSPDARAARAFSVLLLLDLAHALLVFSVMNFVSISAGLSTLIFNILILVILTFYIFVYLHSAYKSIPYIYRLSGIPIVLSLVIVTIAAYTVLHFHSSAYDEINRTHISLIKLDHGKAENPGNPAPAFIGRIEGAGMRVIEREGAHIPPVIQARTWKHVPGGLQMVSGYGSIPLQETGDNRKCFLQVNGHNYLMYSRLHEGSIYCFGFPYRDYLRYMHRSGMVAIVYIVSFMALLMIIMPMLNYFVFILPLRNIINRGDNSGSAGRTYDNELHRLDEILRGTQDAGNRDNLPRDTGDLSRAIRGRLDSIIAYINENFRDEISREGLASMIDLDPDYMSKLFKIYTGIRVGDYINSLRIKEACMLLTDSNASVIDISLRVGFESLRTFNRAFSRLMGMSPSEFRKGPNPASGQNQ